MQPKTIEAYSHAVRCAGKYFHYQIDALTEDHERGHGSAHAHTPTRLSSAGAFGDACGGHQQKGALLAQ